MKTLKMVAAAALMIAATIVGAANAQDQPQQQDSWNGWMMGMWGPRGMMGYGGPRSWMMGRGDVSQAMCNVMANHIEGRLAYIKAELKITEAQESLWNTYAAAAHDNANAMRAHCTAMMSKRSGSAASLPDRLDQHEQFMAAQLDATRAMNKAIKPLYAALSDDQKKTADQLFWGPMGMM
jgi:ATP-dependent Clp protease ATP-binding subunit ClpA